MNKFHFYFSCLLTFSILFSACKGDPKPTQGAQVEFKNNDNTVRFRLPNGPRGLNPAAPRSGYDLTILHYMFQYLMDFSEETLELGPQLVKGPPSVEKLGEGQAFSYEIFEEATWDNGSPVTGHDYAFSIKAVFNPLVPSGGIRDYLVHIKDVVVDEENPKKFTVITRRKYVLAEPTISNAIVLPEYHYDPDGLMRKYSLLDLTDLEKGAKMGETEEDLKKFAEQLTSPEYSREKVVGSGPYRFVEWEDKTKLVVVKKENWWGEKLVATNSLMEAYPDTLVFLFIQDDNTLSAAIKDEGVDVSIAINTRIFDELKEDDFVKARYNFHTPETFNFLYAILNTKNPKLSNPKVRRALAHLTDLDEVNRSYYRGYGVRLAGPFPKGAPYYNADLPLINYDIAKAKELFKEAGWEDTDGDGILDKEIDGEKTQLSLKYTHGGSKFSKDYSQYFANQAKLSGVEIIPEEVDFRKVAGKKLAARDFEIFSLQGAGDPVASMDPYQFWHTDNDKPDGYNRSGFGTAETDKLIEEIRMTTNSEKQNILLKELQQEIYDFQPWIMYFIPQERIIIHKRFEGEATKLKPGIFVNRLKKKN